MTLLLDTSIVIPLLGRTAYERFVTTLDARPGLRLFRDRAGIACRLPIRRSAQQAEAFLDRLWRRNRIVTPTHEDWHRGGLMLARYQSRFGSVKPAAHIGDILILLSTERLAYNWRPRMASIFDCGPAAPVPAHTRAPRLPELARRIHGS